MRWTLSQREDKQIVFILIIAFSLIVFRWKGGGLFSRELISGIFQNFLFRDFTVLFISTQIYQASKSGVRNLSYVNPSPMTFSLIARSKGDGPL